MARKANVLTRLDDRPTQVFDKRTTLINIRILFLEVAIYLNFAENKESFSYSFGERLFVMFEQGVGFEPSVNGEITRISLFFICLEMLFFEA